jgi:uncharacterized membrane protein YgcG
MAALTHVSPSGGRRHVHPSSHGEPGRRLAVLGIVAGVLSFTAAAAAQPLPRLPRVVDDAAAVVDIQDRQHIEAVAKALRAAAGVTLTVVTMPAARGGDADTTATRLADDLGQRLGRPAGDRLLLLLLVADTRTVRLRAGRALGERVEDEFARRIVPDVMTPYLRRRQHSVALREGTNAVAARIAGQQGVQLDVSVAVQAPPGREHEWTQLVLLVGMALVLAVGTYGAMHRKFRERRTAWFHRRDGD